MALKSYVRIYFLLLTFSYVFSSSELWKQDLGGVWSVQNLNYGYNLPAFVPGGIYSDLMRNSVIQDVFYKFNDVNSRWVSETNWNYSTTFIANENVVNQKVINLVFNGIDTFSTIFVNNIAIGSTNNMFVQYVFNIKSHLKLNRVNKIEVQFQSPIKVAKDLFDKQAKSYQVPPVCVPKIYNGECHVNHIRKMQSSFGWDWGPALPSMGIWKSVYLEAYNTTVIRDVVINIFSNADEWDIQVSTYFARNCCNSTNGTLHIKLVTDALPIEWTFEQIRLKCNENDEMVDVRNVSIYQNMIQLWWPNGYGSSKLYPIKIYFENFEKTEKTTRNLKIGFRTVELIQNSLVKGNSFYFKINNVPIYAKGSNSIPISILPELGQNETLIKFLLQSAKDANMNMLRVWGGGVYESDRYYEIADELGLTIWQDFMFACSMYPANDNFLKLVAQEVRHQVKRLHYHPSIVIWAGNNENEAALVQNWYNTKSNYSLYKEDYIKLYVETIKKELFKIEETRTYLTSSPTNGKESDEEGYISNDPESHYFGDVHFYNYLIDGWKTTTYPISRFTSEFGYQSLPSVTTLLTATNNTNDINLDSEFLSSRQHHPMGYSEMILLMNYQLNLPNNKNENFTKSVAFYSQIYQAMAIKIETEYYRRWRSSLNDIGEGLNMGALYWQLNDVWVAPTWAGIDFSNKWKMLHYFAKNFFAPVITTGSIAVDNKLDVYIVSDLLYPVHHAVLNVQIFKWDSLTPVKTQNIILTILPGLAQKVISNLLEDSNNFFKNYCYEFGIHTCFVHLSVRDKYNNTIIAPNNYVFPTSLKDANLQIPNLQITNVNNTGSNTFDIEIKTDAVALFVWLDTKNINGHFSDNGFLQITSTKTIQFRSESFVNVNVLKNSLSITNFMDKAYL